MIKEEEFEDLIRVQEAVLSNLKLFKEEGLENVRDTLKKNAESAEEGSMASYLYDFVYTQIWQPYYTPQQGSPRLQEIYRFLGLMPTTQLGSLAAFFVSFNEENPTIKEVHSGKFDVVVVDLDPDVKNQIEFTKENISTIEVDISGQDLDFNNLFWINQSHRLVYDYLYIPYLQSNGKLNYKWEQILDHYSLSKDSTISDLTNRIFEEMEQEFLEIKEMEHNEN